MSIEEARERYLAAAHGMQSGVAMKMNYDGRDVRSMTGTVLGCRQLARPV